MKRLKNFATDVAKKTWYKVKVFFKGLAQHAEAVTILSLAAVGLNTLIGELPFLFALPMIFEAALVIPVLSVITVSLLAKSAEKRAQNRTALAA